jgi:hypothetical protein
MLAHQRICINRKVDIYQNRFFFSDDGAVLFFLLADPIDGELIKALVFNGRTLTKLSYKKNIFSPTEDCP